MSDDDLDARVIANLRELQRRQAVRPHPPPLRIHHLMACAAVAAVELSLLRLMLNRSPQQTLIGNGVFGYTQVLTAVGLTLTGFSIYWWRKGYASFSQPGQMLLVQYAAALVLQLVSIVFMVLMFSVGGTQRNSSWISFLPITVGLCSLAFGILLPIAFYIWCAWKIADSWPWRMLFVFCALTTILTSSLAFFVAQFVGFGPSNIQMIVGVPYVARGAMLLAAGMLAVVTDLTARRKRSWTHWAGIILWLLGQIGTLLMGLYYLFVWSIA